MLSQPTLAKKLLSQFKKKVKGSCFIGFDGFTDEIISVVEKTNPQTFIKTLKSFGKKIKASSYKSSNFELIVKKVKLGGNAPIFTNALLKGGHSITFAGTIGTSSKIEPLFKKIANGCKKVFPLGKSGKTEALEFTDGKLLLGKMEALNELTYPSLIKSIPEKTLIKIFNEIDLFACFNWAMLPHLTTIWQNLLRNVVPKIDRRKKMFIDLSDPSKRPTCELLEAFDTLSKFSKKFDIILSLNLKEAKIACKALKVPFSLKKLQKTVCALLQKLKIERILIHAQTFALSQDETNYFYAKSFYTKSPKLLTGAGDNFNAGYCNGILLNLSEEEALYTALATSGFYVREGKSPTMQELCTFITRSSKRKIRKLRLKRL
ncbi:MAG TPA: hypothetical protein PLC42_07525 [Parachlamydiaceae bacterium]|nr:hypothetical protein [Parachlamydiaceae bacterium]